MIEVRKLRKRFGPALALDGMTFTALPGRVTGFAGPNGAGKSTTMRVILGLDRPDSGTPVVEGQPYRSLEDASYLELTRDSAEFQETAPSPSG